MTAPHTSVPDRPRISTTRPPTGPGTGATMSTPPDHRTTALQSAVAMLRGRNLAKTDDVLAMSRAFLDFLEEGDKP